MGPHASRSVRPPGRRISLARYLAARPVDHVASLSAVLEHGNCFAVYGGEPTATAAAILETLPRTLIGAEDLVA